MILNYFKWIPELPDNFPSEYIVSYCITILDRKTLYGLTKIENFCAEPMKLLSAGNHFLFDNFIPIHFCPSYIQHATIAGNFVKHLN